jgi:hypothetical protein
MSSVFGVPIVIIGLSELRIGTAFLVLSRSFSHGNSAPRQSPPSLPGYQSSSGKFSGRELMALELLPHWRAI